MLYSVLHSLSLEELRCVKEGTEVGRIKEGICKVANYLSVGACVSLVALHNTGEDVSILGESELFNSLKTREGLEAELGEVAEIVLSVLREGHACVPYLPVVRIAEMLV